MFLQRMVGQNNGRKNFFAHFIKNFFYSNPLFSPTIRCKNIVADDRLDWVYENDLPKTKKVR